MTNDLMHGVFSKDYMLTHSLAGGNKDKPALPKQVVESIIGISLPAFNLYQLWKTGVLDKSKG